MSQGFTKPLPIPLPIEMGGTEATTAAGARTALGAAASGANADITSMTGLTGALEAPTGVNDANGNEVVTFTGVGSAVNYLDFSNSSTAATPNITASGDDANIGISFQSKGTGYYQFLGTSDREAGVLWYEDTSNGSNYIVVAAPSAISSIQTVRWKSASSGYPVLDTVDGDAWTAWSPTFTGFSAAPSGVAARYKKIGTTCFISIDGNAGTSNANTFTISNLPFTSVTGVTQRFSSGRWINNSAAVFGTGLGSIGSASTTLAFSLSDSTTGWTTSNAKMFQGTFVYETA